LPKSGTTNALAPRAQLVGLQCNRQYAPARVGCRPSDASGSETPPQTEDNSTHLLGGEGDSLSIVPIRPPFAPFGAAGGKLSIWGSYENPHRLRLVERHPRPDPERPADYLRVDPRSKTRATALEPVSMSSPVDWTSCGLATPCRTAKRPPYGQRGYCLEVLRSRRACVRNR